MAAFTTQEIFLVLISVTSLVDSRNIVQPKELCQRKILSSPWKIEPATSLLVVHSLNQIHHRVPQLQK